MNIIRKLRCIPIFASVVVLSVFLSGCGQSDSNALNVAVTPSSPPMLYQKDGKIVGAELDIFRDFAKEKGYTLNLTAYDWAGMLGAVTSGKADVAFSAISITPKREKVMDFSTPYIGTSWYLVSLEKRNVKINDLAQLKKYSIGYPRGMAYSGLIKDKLEPKGYYSLADVKLYPTYNEVVTDLKNGNLDLAFIEEPVYDNYKFKQKQPFDISYSFENIDHYGFAFKKGSSIRQEFNQYLASQRGKEEVQKSLDLWMKG